MKLHNNKVAFIDFKHIFNSVIVLLIALFIFSYLTAPSTGPQVWSVFDPVKLKISPIFEKGSQSVQGSDSKLPFNSCQNKARILIPKYVILLNDGICTKAQGTFTDGTGFESKGKEYCDFEFTQGVSKGENVNYLYSRNSPLIYRNKVISYDGVVLGEKFFAFDYALKKIDVPVDYRWLQSDDGKILRAYLNWSSLEPAIYNQYRADKIILEVQSESGWQVFCSNESEPFAKSAELICDIQIKPYSTDHYKIVPKPNIITSMVYELVEVSIAECEGFNL